MDCKCETCKSACEHRPGFFRPGEVEQAASAKGMSLQEFFDKYLVVDFWAAEDEGEDNTFLLAPATTYAITGEVAPLDPRGTCVFYKEGGCEIHENKPAECRFYDHTKSSGDSREFRKEVVNEWKNHPQQLEELLGRKPTVPESSFFDLLGFF